MSFIDSIDKDVKFQRKSREYALLAQPYEVVPISSLSKFNRGHLNIATCHATNRREAEIKFTLMLRIDPTCLLGSWEVEEIKALKKAFN